MHIVVLLYYISIYHYIVCVYIFHYLFLSSFFFFFYFYLYFFFFFFFSSRRRHTRYIGDWSSDVCSSDLRPRVPLSHTSVVLDGRALQAPHQGGLAPGPRQHRAAGVTGAGDPRVHPDRARARARGATKRALPGAQRKPPPGVPGRCAVSGAHGAAGRRLCGGRAHARDVVRRDARAGGRAHDRGCDPLLRLRHEPARPDEGAGALLLPVQQGQRRSRADRRGHEGAERRDGPSRGAGGLGAEG